jgi:hypothetical protein
VTRHLRATAPTWHNNQKPHISPDLNFCSHIFIRQDSVKGALQHLYDEPFPVVKHSDKCFTLTVHGQQPPVLIDRLKPAHIDVVPQADISPIGQSPVSTSTTKPAASNRDCCSTCSGRRVRWLDRLTLISMFCSLYVTYRGCCSG